MTAEFTDWLAMKTETRDDAATARAIGVSSGAQLSKWRAGTSVTLASCRTIADHARWPLMEVVIAAGLLTPDEAGVNVIEVPRQLTDTELAAQVTQRLNALSSEVAEMRDHVTRLQGKLQAVNDIARDKQHDSGVRAELRQALRDESA